MPTAKVEPTAKGSPSTESKYDGMSAPEGGPHLPPMSAVEEDLVNAKGSCLHGLRLHLMYTDQELRAGKRALEMRDEVHRASAGLEVVEAGSKKGVSWYSTLDALSTPEHPLDAASKESRVPGFRGQVLKFLESDMVSLSVLVLIILDVVAVFGELMLSNVCDPSRASVHSAEGALHKFSLTIVFIFAAQQLTLLAAEGPSHYFTNFWYVVDFVVVMSSIILDFAIASKGGKLVVVLMGWRIVRVVHGFVTTVEMQQHQVSHFKSELEAMATRIRVLTQWRLTLLRARRIQNRATLIQGVLVKWRAKVARRRAERAAAEGGHPDDISDVDVESPPLPGAMDVDSKQMPGA